MASIRFEGDGTLKLEQRLAMQNYIDAAMSFAEYIELIDGLLAEGKTTGPVQSESMLAYGKINRQRMQRLEKTLELEAATREAVMSAGREMIWLVITEGWCGDAAQNIPAIEKIAAASSRIHARYVLRDDNLDLMDRFLTRGARSIPKLIALDAGSLEILGTWGPRAEAAQQYFDALKAEGLEKAEISEKIQRWYNDDRGRSLQAEFVRLVPDWAAEFGKAAVAGDGH